MTTEVIILIPKKKTKWYNNRYLGVRNIFKDSNTWGEKKFEEGYQKTQPKRLFDHAGQFFSKKKKCRTIIYTLNPIDLGKCLTFPCSLAHTQMCYFSFNSKLTLCCDVCVCACVHNYVCQINIHLGLNPFSFNILQKDVIWTCILFSFLVSRTFFFFFFWRIVCKHIPKKKIIEHCQKYIFYQMVQI